MRRFSAVVVLVLVTVPGAAQAPDPVKIGVQSLFDELPEAEVAGLIKTFEGLVKDLTAFNGKAVQGGDAYTLAQDLKEGKVHLGVFQGYEFAWAQPKHPKLKPLMIGVYYDPKLRASVLVQQTYKADSLAELKGKNVAVAVATPGHARVFLDRLVAEQAKTTAKEFFSKVVRPANAEAALDALCDDEVQCAVVDNVSLETYKQVKAGPFKRLRVLKQSEVFPPSVVAYYEGGLDQATLSRFVNGMLEANKSAKAKEMMSTFKITSFDPVPADYPQMLANTLKLHPAPEKITPREKAK